MQSARRETIAYGFIVVSVKGIPILFPFFLDRGQQQLSFLFCIETPAQDVYSLLFFLPEEIKSFGGRSVLLSAQLSFLSPFSSGVRTPLFRGRPPLR